MVSKNFRLIKRTVMLVILLGFIVLAVLLYIFSPLDGVFPPCPFNYLTGLYCPGCGSLRSMHSIFHGQFINAIDYNILVVFLLLIFAYIFFTELDFTIKGRPILKRIYFNKTFTISLIAVIVLFTILRNIDYYPFSLLAP